MHVLDEMRARGMIAQVTHEEELRKVMDEGPVTFYNGFDPTGDSMTVGHLVPVIGMAFLQRAGHRPIALFGGGTGMVADPAGKTELRKILTLDEIAHNIAGMSAQMSHLLDFAGGTVLPVDNGDWLRHLNYVDFIREIGVHFPVNRMLAADVYKTRLETGLTFFEMNYMVMQSYDFLLLNRTRGCTLQTGGDDQWSNILAGADLIRRVEGKPAFAMTFPLWLTSDGKKMGKSEKGAVWLDEKRTSVYDFYQYWRGLGDADVIPTMKRLTFVPMEEIAEYEKLAGNELNPVKERLAYELTAIVHGADKAAAARDAARSVFGGSGESDDMPTTELTAAEIANGLPVLDLLLRTGLVPSKGEGRRLIEQGGLMVNDAKVTDIAASIAACDFADGALLLRKGKKQRHRVVLK